MEKYYNKKVKVFFENGGEKMEELSEKLDIYEKQEEPIFSFESGAYNNGVTLLKQDSTADYLDIKLEYQGFCIVTLLSKRGLLVSGRPDVVAKYNEKSEIQIFA
mgnify:CR=1 FL=1